MRRALLRALAPALCRVERTKPFLAPAPRTVKMSFSTLSSPLNAPRSAAAKATTTAKDKPKAPKMPSYKSWTVARLSEEADKYSFVPSSNKAELVQRLEAVWRAVHGVSDPSASSGSDRDRASPVAGPSKPRARRKSSSSSVSVLSSGSDAGNVQGKRSGTGRARSPRAKQADVIELGGSSSSAASEQEGDASSSFFVHAVPARRATAAKGKGKARATGADGKEPGALSDATTDSDEPLVLSSPSRIAKSGARSRSRSAGASADDSDASDSAAAGPSGKARAGRKKTAAASAKGKGKAKSTAKEAAPKKGRGKGKGKAKASAGLDDDASDSDDADGLITTPSGSDDGAEAAELAAAAAASTSQLSARDVSLRLKRAVRADAQLWRRVLLMEPISLDEFASVANRPPARGGAGIAIATQRQRLELRSWLEMQGICVYAEDMGYRNRRS